MNDVLFVINEYDSCIPEQTQFLDYAVKMKTGKGLTTKNVTKKEVTWRVFCKTLLFESHEKLHLNIRTDGRKGNKTL